MTLNLISIDFIKSILKSFAKNKLNFGFMKMIPDFIDDLSNIIQGKRLIYFRFSFLQIFEKKKCKDFKNSPIIFKE